METSADIQVENGNWAKVHNTILKKLAFIKLDGREAKCLFFLFSMTYGNREKEHAISLSLWATGTDLDKRNVAKVIDGLIARNIIYRTGNGRGRGSITIYGFNKHFEDWDISTEKVSSITPIEKVLPITPFLELKVLPITPEKVLPITPTTEREQQSSLLATNESDDSKALMIRAYETVCKFGPPMREAKGRADLAVAMELIDRFGYQACIDSLVTLKERHNTMLTQHGRRGIEAPLPYLRTLMEGSINKPSFVIPTTVDFALEDVSQ